MRILDNRRTVRRGLSIGGITFLLTFTVIVLPHMQAKQRDFALIVQDVALAPQGAALTFAAQADQGQKTKANKSPPPTAQTPASIPTPLVAPVSSVEATAKQAEWARHLKTPQVMSNSLDIKLVLIPSGEFEMGADEPKQILDGFDFAHERPVHRVRITRPFYLAQTEVTVGQFRKFVTAKSYISEAERDGKGGGGFDSNTQYTEKKPHFNWKNTGFMQDDQHPVVNVTWNDATAFCAWLSETDGASYRLPSEAEWEFACRAGTTSRYWTGDDAGSLSGAGNYWDQSARQIFTKTGEALFLRFNDGSAFTAPVGRFTANAFGLYDMHGNVWEWCLDSYDSGYYARSPLSDPVNTQGEQFRVRRGGGWSSNAVDCRAANRSRNVPDRRSFDLGFRVARLLPMP